MKVEIRMPTALHAEAMADLMRPHPFALERVGFLSANCSWLASNHVVVLLSEYHPVPDEHYRDDDDAGASIGSDAICDALARILHSGRGQFHVHVHEHRGVPFPSRVDRIGLPPMVKSFAITAPSQASGYLILSKDSAWAEVFALNFTQPLPATKITCVGFPFQRLL
jgi:hypothetical protein